jgi:hypothetical protein
MIGAYEKPSEAIGVLMMWNGMMGVLLPVEHCRAIRGGPRWWREAVDWFAARPAVARAAAIAGLVAGASLLRFSAGAADHATIQRSASARLNASPSAGLERSGASAPWSSGGSPASSERSIRTRS